MSRTVLVTGATGGIGKAISLKLAKEGYSLQLHFNQNINQALLLQQEILNEYQVEVTLHRADLSTSEGVKELMASLYKHPDILIHNAGISHYGLFTDIKQDDYQRMIQVLLTSPFQLTQLILPSMISNRWGRILFVASIWGETGASCETLYSMAKGGLISLTKALSKEVAPSGITVNAVSPGAINTAMLSTFDEEELARLSDEIPMGRLGSPAEVAHTAHFLIEEESSYITGQVIRVNGGWYT